MIYFTTKKEIEEVKRFRRQVSEFWKVEELLKVRYSSMARYDDLSDEDANHFESLQNIREYISKTTPKMQRLARQNGVPADLQSYPAPMVGGPVIPVNLFQAILHDDSHSGIDKQRILDTINTLIGQLEERIEMEFKNVINPFYWLGLIIEIILRVPFWLLSKTGFDVNKIEEHFLGKLFKSLGVILILYIAVKLGVSDEVLSQIFPFLK